MPNLWPILQSNYARKLQLQSHKYKQFTGNDDYRVAIYERKMFIRLATGQEANLIDALQLQRGNEDGLYFNSGVAIYNHKKFV